MTSKVNVPPGSTFFDVVGDRSFAKLKVDSKGIPTLRFLEAASGLTELFGLIGGVAFTPVQNDMAGNIKKIRARHDAAPMQSQTVQSLVRAEHAENKSTATEGLLWLTRGLDFTSQAIAKNVANPSEELSTSFREAYTNTLRPHHSMLVKPIFSAAMSATPYRADFYKKLGDDQEKVDVHLKEWMKGLQDAVEIIKRDLASLDSKRWKV